MSPFSDTYASRSLKFQEEFAIWWDSLLRNPYSEWGSTWNSACRAITQLNIIERQLRKELSALQLSNYGYLNLDLVIWPATPFNPRMYDEGCSDIQFFNFGTPRFAYRAMPIQLVHDLEGILWVLVKFDRQWQPFQSLLDTIIASEPPDIERHRSLWQLHALEGRFFRLLDLPRELRDIIYLKALFLNDECRAFPYRYAWWRGKKHRDVWTCPSFHNLSLIHVGNRRVHEEVIQILYSEAKFEFTRPHHFSWFLGDIQHGIAGTAKWKMIRHLRLDFTHIDWLKWLGAQLSSEHRYNSCPQLHNLTKLNPRNLTIYIHPPEVMEGTWLWKENHGGPTSVGCQTKAVQWILDLLTPYITHLSSQQLHIEGYVKYRQKNKFIEKLRRYQENQTGLDVEDKDVREHTDTGGVLLNHQEAQANLAGPDCRITAGIYDSVLYDSEAIHPDIQLPPICECKHQCCLDPGEFLMHIEDDDFAMETDP